MSIKSRQPLPEAQLDHVTGGASQPGCVEYIVRAGDTLASVAARYRVSESDIRTLNHLTSDELRVGQVLRIPVNQRAMDKPARRP